MKKCNDLLELAKKNNGTITISMAEEMGYSRGNIKYLVDAGYLEHTSRGVYSLPDVWEDQYVVLQNRYKKGIYSLDSALFLCGLSEEIPSRICMTFPLTYNITNPKNDGIICKNIKNELYELGVVLMETPDGNKVHSYNAERTICDILRPVNHMDSRVISAAIKHYLSGEVTNIPLLTEYAVKLKIEAKLKTYLEVLM